MSTTIETKTIATARGVSSNGLRLTQIEYDRLLKAQEESNKRAVKNWKKVTPEKRQEIIKQRNMGKSLRSIAADTRSSALTIRKILDEEGIR